MTAEPVLAFVDQIPPTAPIVRLNVGGVLSHFLVNGEFDGDLEAVELSRLRPFPAYDGLAALAECCKCDLSEMIKRGRGSK